MSVYCIPIHVPIYVDGPRCFVISEWFRALNLLRDSLSSHFSCFRVVAPYRLHTEANQLLVAVGKEDGFDMRPSVHAGVTKRDYFLRGGRRKWREDVLRALDSADFAHTAVSDLYLPIGSDAIGEVYRRGVPSAFFLDTDVIEQQKELIANGLMRNGPDRPIYSYVYDRHLRRVVAKADVAMLKGCALMERYGPYAKNPKCFHDTSYRSSEIVSEEFINSRIAARKRGSLRLVYFGRLVERKGCHQAIDVVARAREAGADITLDLIGDGDQREKLEAEVARRGLSGVVVFLGERQYGPELLLEVARYDGLLFTPIAEDTPRMIFDGYAAGLPLFGFEISYVRERAREDKATLLLPKDDNAEAADRLMELSSSPERLTQLTRAALSAGRANSTDVWYEKRAQWTIEAFTEARLRK